MAAPPFPNEYTLRTVAEVSSKPCYVCHKPTTRVLTTVGNKVGAAVSKSMVLHRGVPLYFGFLRAWWNSYEATWSMLTSHGGNESRYRLLQHPLFVI